MKGNSDKTQLWATKKGTSGVGEAHEEGVGVRGRGLHKEMTSQGNETFGLRVRDRAEKKAEKLVGSKRQQRGGWHFYYFLIKRRSPLLEPLKPLKAPHVFRGGHEFH